MWEGDVGRDGASCRGGVWVWEGFTLHEVSRIPV